MNEMGVQKNAINARQMATMGNTDSLWYGEERVLRGLLAFSG